MMLPEVSVIVPNYNHASYLVQRIESILNQTFQDFELLILDDCSTDNSKDIIEQYRNHPKVKVIVYNEENSGSTFRQWNKGIDMAQGKYIWIAESDDVAETNLLETLLPPLQDNNVHIAYCQSNRLSGDGIVTGTWLTHTEDLASRLFRKNFRMNGVRFINKFLIYKNVIPNASAVVFRKSAFYQAGAADDCIETCADWLLWMKMLMSGDVYFHATALNNFRYHSQSVIAKASEKPEIKLVEYVYTMRIYFEKFLQTNNQLRKREQLIRKNRQEIMIQKIRFCLPWYYNKVVKTTKWKRRYYYICYLTKHKALYAFFRKWAKKQFNIVKNI